MKVNFKKLEDFLMQYGYAENEMMDADGFEIPEKTSYEYLIDHMQNHKNIVAMTFFGRKITYGEFAEEIDQTSKALKGLGLKDGDRIATLLPNIPETAYLQYGASKIGAVPSNIDPRTTGQMLVNYIQNEHIKSIVVVKEMYQTAIAPVERELKERYGIDRVVVVPATNSLPAALKGAVAFKGKIHHDQPVASAILDVVYWDDLIQNTRYENAEDIGFRADREAMIEHSSGTLNGMPKSIPLTNENINTFVEKHLPTDFGKFSAGTKLLNVLPYFASYGAVNSSHLGFNLGMTLQQIPEFDFKDFGYIAYKHKSEILIGTPTWFSLAARDKRLKKDALKNVKIAISGGGQHR